MADYINLIGTLMTAFGFMLWTFNFLIQDKFLTSPMSFIFGGMFIVGIGMIYLSKWVAKKAKEEAMKGFKK